MRAGQIISAVFGTVLKVVFGIVVILLIYKGAIFCYDFGYRIFTEPAISDGAGRTLTVAVTESMSPWDIGEAFEQKGLVKDGKLFAFQYLLSEYRKDVRPGVFEFDTTMTAEEMMKVMATPVEIDEEATQ